MGWEKENFQPTEPNGSRKAPDQIGKLEADQCSCKTVLRSLEGEKGHGPLARYFNSRKFRFLKGMRECLDIGIIPSGVHVMSCLF